MQQELDEVPALAASLGRLKRLKRTLAAPACVLGCALFPVCSVHQPALRETQAAAQFDEELICQFTNQTGAAVRKLEAGVLKLRQLASVQPTQPQPRQGVCRACGHHIQPAVTLSHAARGADPAERSDLESPHPGEPLSAAARRSPPRTPPRAMQRTWSWSRWHVGAGAASQLAAACCGARTATSRRPRRRHVYTCGDAAEASNRTPAHRTPGGAGAMPSPHASHPAARAASRLSDTVQADSISFGEKVLSCSFIAMPPAKLARYIELFDQEALARPSVTRDRTAASVFAVMKWRRERHLDVGTRTESLSLQRQTP